MSIKTVATFAIIIGCFAVLYPKFIHPVMVRLFGLQTKNLHEGKADSGSPYYPPGRRPDERRPAQGADIRQHMRPGGPHPGMRAAAEMHRQHQSQHGTGRGMMGIVLPMYAVGIVLYLVYTLVKVFGKKEKSEQSSYDYSNDTPTYPCAPTPKPAARTPQEKTKELQDLLMKADDKSINSEEMKELQRRLEETESQMSKILQAMQVVQNKIETTDAPEPKKSTDSSPDMDSYEIVNKREQSGEKAKPVPENVTAEETRETKEETDTSSETKNSEDDNTEASKVAGNKEVVEEVVVEEAESCVKEKASEEEMNKEEEEVEEVILRSKEEAEQERSKNIRHRQVAADTTS